MQQQTRHVPGTLSPDAWDTVISLWPETPICFVSQDKKSPETYVLSGGSLQGNGGTAGTHLPASHGEIGKYAVFLILVTSVCLQALKRQVTDC
jgi:hypothetical protein